MAPILSSILFLSLPQITERLNVPSRCTSQTDPVSQEWAHGNLFDSRQGWDALYTLSFPGKKINKISPLSASDWINWFLADLSCSLRRCKEFLMIFFCQRCCSHRSQQTPLVCGARADVMIKVWCASSWHKKSNCWWAAIHNTAERWKLWKSEVIFRAFIFSTTSKHILYL